MDRSKLYRAQDRALEFVRDRVARGRKGSLLNMAMGTGKSRVAIEYLKEQAVTAKIQGKTLMVIIACPCALLPEPKAKNPGGWAGEVKKWWGEAEEFGGHRIPRPVFYASQVGTTEKRSNEIAQLCKEHAHELAGVPLIVAQSYDSWRTPFLMRLASRICATKTFYRILVMDESHRAKTPTSATSKFCHRLADKCDHTLLLTGTPMPQNPLDLWSQFRCLDIALFGDNYYRFRSRYAMFQDYGGIKIFRGMRGETAAELREKFDMGAFSLRLEDAVDIPPLTHKNVPIQLSAREKKAYSEMSAYMYASLSDDVRKGVEVTAANVLSQIGKLAQITGGAVKLEDGTIAMIDHVARDKHGRYKIESSKGKMVEELLGDIEPDEPVVIFCRFKADMAICHEAIANAGRESFELSGSRKELEKWRADSGGSVIVVQESAGGVGVDLTRARYVIYYSVNYSLGDFEQSLARLHRNGQTRPVLAIHFIATGTIDEVIRGAIEGKRNVVNAVLESAGIERSEAI